MCHSCCFDSKKVDGLDGDDYFVPYIRDNFVRKTLYGKIHIIVYRKYHSSIFIHQGHKSKIINPSNSSSDKTRIAVDNRD